MNNGQERGKESESVTRVPGRLWNCLEAADRRELDATRARQNGRGKREKKDVPIHAGLLVGCLFRVRPFSKRVFD